MTTTFSRLLTNEFLITLEIRCLQVRSNCVRKYNTIPLRVGSSFLITFFWYICITNWNSVTVYLSLWRAFITSQLRFLFVQMVTFFDDVRITLNYGNCWNVWIVYGSYVIKMEIMLQSCFIFLQHIDKLFKTS